MSVLKLPCVRFVRQVSNGAQLSKYGYIGMMERNAEALRTAMWRKAMCKPEEVTLTVNKVAETDGVFNDDTGAWDKLPSYTAYMRDFYDCFKQGGDAVKSTGTMCGYAGMVAYRFTLPTVNPGAIDEMQLLIQRDRYLRCGVRVAAELNDSEKPSNDWNIIRGEAEGAIVSPFTPSGGALGAASWGFLQQSEVPWLLATRAGEDTLTFSAGDFAGLAGAATAKYLWVYLSLEDYCDYWELYKSDEQRFYSIEGSAQLVASCCSFTFATDAQEPELEESTPEDEGGSFNNREISVTSIDAVTEFDVGNFAGLRGMAAIAVPFYKGMAAIQRILEESEEGVSVVDGSVVNAGSAMPLENFGKLLPVRSPWPGVDPFLCYLEPSNTPRYQQDESGVVSVINYSRLLLGIGCYLVPSSKSKYSRVRFQWQKSDIGSINSHGAVGIIGSDYWPGVRFNVWRSKSLAFCGPYANIATAALAAKAAMYTRATNSVAAAIEGSGGAVDGVVVSAEAEYVTDFTWSEILTEETSDSWKYSLPVECAPGEAILIAPKFTIAPVPLGAYESTERALNYFIGKFVSSGDITVEAAAGDLDAMDISHPTVSFY